MTPTLPHKSAPGHRKKIGLMTPFGWRLYTKGKNDYGRVVAVQNPHELSLAG
jgi:hypothetical protein